LKMFKIWICGQVFIHKKHLSTFVCISKYIHQSAFGWLPLLPAHPQE
jgi:hypothetical protein